MTQLGPFEKRHLGPRQNELKLMLDELGLNTMEELISKTLPASIVMKKPYGLDKGQSETDSLRAIEEIGKSNQVYRSFIGLGYAGTRTPAVIQRNILENPGWYTQYTPYQAEISQGRLEALINFQTLICDLTGLPVSNASLLDEGTAAAEAMTMSYALHGKSKRFLVADHVFPQTLEILKTRANPLGIEVCVSSVEDMDFDESVFGVLVQLPAQNGEIWKFEELAKKARSKGVLVTAACDVLSLCVMEGPGKLGADIVVGNTQRFGVPLGFGGPHAAFFATREEYKRSVPGRIVGVSKDKHGNQAYRLALQTREQHIRREKATSNICTSQVLLAILASMYAVYHGPEGLVEIANQVFSKTKMLFDALKAAGLKINQKNFFDTLTIELEANERTQILSRLKQKEINVRDDQEGSLSITLDETVRAEDISDLVECFSGKPVNLKWALTDYNGPYKRTSALLEHSNFHQNRSETEMLRYMTRLQNKDLSLTTSMIPLGSCTMKLNATSEMLPITWPEFASIHPFAPKDQVKGYWKLFESLEKDLCEITGFDAVSLQPNAGSQGEYAGLLVIRAFHESKGQGNRNVCLIPKSAHGTNPASATMAGMKTVVVACDRNGNIDLEDLKHKADSHQKNLAALMVTYPSTHGVFEEEIDAICKIVHQCGGQVYMDGANMNAQVGLCRPGDYGPDVCHLNLHKTFSIPHGGGGPGIGPIGVKAHLKEFLPSHWVLKRDGISAAKSIGTIAAAPWGSAGILPISWMYIKMMGGNGLKRASEIAILNANYLAHRLEPYYPVLYRGRSGTVAHECIVDLRPIKAETGIEVEDVAKRLMDYGFHAPTVSFPVIGTMMIEPTESESKQELDRFIEAMVEIRGEISEIAEGKVKVENSLLKNAPHTGFDITQEWSRPYSRERAVFPVKRLKNYKYWPPVSRIDNVYGDRNLFCTCPNLDE